MEPNMYEIVQRLTALETKVAGLVWANLGTLAFILGTFAKIGIKKLFNGRTKK